MPPSITDREPRPGDERLVTADRAPHDARAALRPRRRRTGRPRGPPRRRRRGAGGRRRRRAAARDRRAHGRRRAARRPTSSSTRRAAARACRRWCARRAGPTSRSRPRTPASSTTRASSAPATAARRSRAGRCTRRSSRFSVLTLPADAGTWSVTLYASAGDQPLKRMRHEDAWTAVDAGVPAARALARGRADHRRSWPMGGTRRPAPAHAGRRRADRRGAGRRRVGVHEPVARPRHRARPPARVAPARGRRRAPRRPGRTRPRVGRGH